MRNSFKCNIDSKYVSILYCIYIYIYIYDDDDDDDKVY